MRKLADDCFVSDRPRLLHAEAIAILQARIARVAEREEVALIEASGRTLAENITTHVPVPMHTNAAVDGYAFAAADYDRASGSTFRVAARITAGRAIAAPVPAQSAVRIFTGAVMPANHDTCAMQEDCIVHGDHVTIPPGLKPGANVRKAGEDVAAGAHFMSAGDLVRPQDLAALASVGLARVPVFTRLRVGILSSGDEVVRPGETLAHGQVYDANMPMLSALVAATGAKPIDLGVAPDQPETLHATLRQAARTCDVVITSGGASKGEEDHMVAALEALGKRHLWQLAIKPGRPMSFGQIGDCVVLGLPGNPVAVFVCFLLYAFPLLRRMGGAPWFEPVRYTLPAAFAFEGRKSGRREYWRGMFATHQGSVAVDKFRRDGSGLISGLRAADGFIEIPENHGDVREGDPVTFIPFSCYGIGR
jgi:molybdopterin molybdotransferase